MSLQLYLIQVISCFLLIVISSVTSDVVNNNESYEPTSPVLIVKSPLHRMYLEWLAENLRSEEVRNSDPMQIYHEMLEKRNMDSRFPELEAYFIYKINRNKCINLGDEGCVNGSLPGSGSDSGYLNGGNNPGK